jgi:hypothetical protein
VFEKSLEDEDPIEQVRRNVYSQNLVPCHWIDEDCSQVNEIALPDPSTSLRFRHHHIPRCRVFLDRDLSLLLGSLYDPLLLEYVERVLLDNDGRPVSSIYDFLRPYLADKTEKFVAEVLVFVKLGFDVKAFDSRVEYVSKDIEGEHMQNDADNEVNGTMSN